MVSEKNIVERIEAEIEADLAKIKIKKENEILILIENTEIKIHRLQKGHAVFIGVLHG